MSKRFPRMGWIIMVALLSLSLAILPACGGGGGGGGIPYKNAGIFVQQTIGGVDSLDPAWAYDTASGEQLYYIYEGLVGYDGTSTDTFVGLVADSWSAAPNSSQITFHIRPGVKFSNGDNLTAEDVEYSFERHLVTDPYDNGGPVWMLYYPLLDVYDSSAITSSEIDNAVEVVNSTYVQFNLVRAFPMTTFLQILCGSWGAVIDKDWAILQGDWDGTWGNWTNWNNPEHADLILNDKAMGSGPWALDVWTPPGEIKLVRNTNYWKGNATIPFDRIITKYVQEWASRKLALLAGDADLVYCPRTNMNELLNVTGVNAISSLPELTIDSFFFNMAIVSNSTYIGSGALDGNGIPPNFFSDINVRKGFSYAFNWATYIAQAMQGEAAQRGSPVVSGLPYFNASSPMYSFCSTLATSYLQAAWNGTLWTNGCKFTLIYNTGNLVRKTACEILANNLFAINPLIQVSVLAKPWTSTLAMIRTRTMPMFQIGWLPDYADPDNFVYPFMHSTGTFAKYQSYNSTLVDDLIEEGAVSVNATRRAEIYGELQQIYYNDAPGIMLVQPLGRRFFTTYIHGFTFNPTTSGQPGPLYYMTKSNP